MSFLQSVRGKFLATLSIGVLGLCVVFALSLDSIRNIENSYRAIRDNAIAGKMTALDIAKDINYFSRLTRNIMLGGDIDKDLKQIDAVIASVSGKFEFLAARDFDAQARALVDKARTAAQDFVRNGRDLVAPLKSVDVQDRPRAYADYEKKATPAAMAFREHFGNFEKIMTERADAAMASLAEQMAARRGLLWTVFGAAVLLVYAAGFLLTNCDLKAMRRCVAFAGELGDNADVAPLETTRCASMRALAEALNRTARNLADFRKETAGAHAEAEKERDEARKALENARLANQQAGQAQRQGAAQAAASLEGVIGVVNATCGELLEHIRTSSRGAADQARRAEGAAAGMEQMNAAVADVARNASRAVETADGARDRARDGARVVNQVTRGVEDVRASSLELKQAMSSLGNQAEGISQVMTVINDIADQTNLLALNAAIEAARAGDAGRGFAVVADEVRKLAEKTMTATKEVGSAIHGIQNGARDSVARVEHAVGTIENVARDAGQSGESLAQIVALAGQASDQIRAIAAAAEQQSSASSEIARSVDQVSAISGQVSQAMNSAADAVSGMADQARVLGSLVAKMQA